MKRCQEKQVTQLHLGYKDPKKHTYPRSKSPILEEVRQEYNNRGHTEKETVTCPSEGV